MLEHQAHRAEPDAVENVAGAAVNCPQYFAGTVDAMVVPMVLSGVVDNRRLAVIGSEPEEPTFAADNRTPPSIVIAPVEPGAEDWPPAGPSTAAVDVKFAFFPSAPAAAAAAEVATAHDSSHSCLHSNPVATFPNVRHRHR